MLLPTALNAHLPLHPLFCNTLTDSDHSFPNEAEKRKSGESSRLLIQHLWTRRGEQPRLWITISDGCQEWSCDQPQGDTRGLLSVGLSLLAMKHRRYTHVCSNSSFLSGFPIHGQTLVFNTPFTVSVISDLKHYSYLSAFLLSSISVLPSVYLSAYLSIWPPTVPIWQACQNVICLTFQNCYRNLLRISTVFLMTLQLQPSVG